MKEYSTKYLISTFQNYEGQQKQKTSEKLSKSREA